MPRFKRFPRDRRTFGPDDRRATAADWEFLQHFQQTRLGTSNPTELPLYDKLLRQFDFSAGRFLKPGFAREFPPSHGTAARPAAL